jgi:hypothetical protein
VSTTGSYCPGPGDTGEQQPPAELYPPENYPSQPYPAPYDPNAYAAYPIYGADPYATTPSEPEVVVPLGWDGYDNYYDSPPVQFAYTPANIAPLAPVVRPDPARPSPFALILPRQARRSLHELVAAKPAAPVDHGV